MLADDERDPHASTAPLWCMVDGQTLETATGEFFASNRIDRPDPRRNRVSSPRMCSGEGVDRGENDIDIPRVWAARSASWPSDRRDSSKRLTVFAGSCVSRIGASAPESKACQQLTERRLRGVGRGRRTAVRAFLNAAHGQ